MSHWELNRVEVIQATVSWQLTQWRAADRLGLTMRQVKRLVHR